MKICLLRRRFSATGGAERFTQRLAGTLHAKGHEISIWSEQWPISEEKAYRVESIASHDPVSFAQACLKKLKSGNHNELVFSLERTLCQDIYRAGDGVHACWLKRRGARQTWLQRFWSQRRRKHRMFLELEQKVFSRDRTRWIIANSKLVQQEIAEHFSFPKERIRVIHPGVNTEFFCPCLDAERKRQLKKLHRIPDDAITWCFVGSGFERKGLEEAIRIAALQQNPEVWLLVLGKGSQAPFVAQSHKLKFGPRLRFVAEGSRALDVYHASDAFILPTIYDPCSNATLEAAACGLPVITTIANGAAELVPGIALEDLSKVEENADRCRIHARPLRPSLLSKELHHRLDEEACWEQILHLIDQAANDLLSMKQEKKSHPDFLLKK